MKPVNQQSIFSPYTHQEIRHCVHTNRMGCWLSSLVSAHKMSASHQELSSKKFQEDAARLLLLQLHAAIHICKVQDDACDMGKYVQNRMQTRERTDLKLCLDIWVIEFL